MRELRKSRNKLLLTALVCNLLLEVASLILVHIYNTVVSIELSFSKLLVQLN